MKTDRSSWRQEWRVLLLWLLALLAAFALLAAVTRALAQHHLQRDAEDIALRYADVVDADHAQFAKYVAESETH